MKHTFSRIEVLLYRPQIFDGLWEATPIVVADLETGEIVAASPPAHRMFRYATEQLVGQTIDQLVPMGQRARHASHRAEYAQAPKLRRMGHAGMDLLGQRSDGTTFPVAIQLSPKRIADRDMVIAVIVDRSDGHLEAK